MIVILLNKKQKLFLIQQLNKNFLLCSNFKLLIDLMELATRGAACFVMKINAPEWND